MQAKFARTQALYMMGRMDFGLIKAGELGATIALKLAGMDSYCGKVSESRRKFATLLK